MAGLSDACCGRQFTADGIFTDPTGAADVAAVKSRGVVYDVVV